MYWYSELRNVRMIDCWSLELLDPSCVCYGSALIVLYCIVLYCECECQLHIAMHVLVTPRGRNVIDQGRTNYGHALIRTAR